MPRARCDSRDEVGGHAIEHQRGAHYKRPVLVGIDDPVALSVFGEVHRSCIPLDDHDFAKAKRGVKRAASFATK